MKLSRLLFHTSGYLLLLCIVATTYLYLYPFSHRCSFPSQVGDSSSCPPDTRACRRSYPAQDAPFRLLALGDPQLEGDSSFPDPNDPWFPAIEHALHKSQSAVNYYEQLDLVRETLTNILHYDIPNLLFSCRKRIDLFGNDYYLAHIYRTLHWYTNPTHVTVLGDLLGSQWINDEEFERRSWRFWNRVFAGGQRVGENITDKPIVQDLGQEDEQWRRRIINIAGNHDIGYAGDIDEKRIERFERVYDKVNWEIRFRHPIRDHSPESVEALETTDETSEDILSRAPEIRILVLNSMNLDTPALAPELQSQTYDFLNEFIMGSRPVTDNKIFTLVLTHIPLHKKPGVCVDAPWFDFFPAENGGGVREQNHISDYVSQSGILEGVFGMSGALDAENNGIGRKGLILTGHDHEGCDVLHYLNISRVEGEDSSWEWDAVRWKDAVENGMADKVKKREDLPGVREVTLRSMMGEFGGWAGLVSLWWDENHGWQYEVKMCPFMIQHWWWAVHIVDIICMFGFILAAVVWALERGGSEKPALGHGKAIKTD